MDAGRATTEGWSSLVSGLMVTELKKLRFHPMSTYINGLFLEVCVYFLDVSHSAQIKRRTPHNCPTNSVMRGMHRSTHGDG